MKTVWLYIDRRNNDKPLIFADQDAAHAWFEQNDPEGVAFEYPVTGRLLPGDDDVFLGNVRCGGG